MPFTEARGCARRRRPTQARSCPGSPGSSPPGPPGLSPRICPRPQAGPSGRRRPLRVSCSTLSSSSPWLSPGRDGRSWSPTQALAHVLVRSPRQDCLQALEIPATRGGYIDKPARAAESCRLRPGTAGPIMRSGTLNHDAIPPLSSFLSRLPTDPSLALVCTHPACGTSKSESVVTVYQWEGIS